MIKKIFAIVIVVLLALGMVAMFLPALATPQAVSAPTVQTK